jgi:hypothetical protein
MGRVRHFAADRGRFLLGDFDPANAPLEPYGDLDMAAWQPIDLMPQFGCQMVINISKAWGRRKDPDRPSRDGRRKKDGRGQGTQYDASRS